MGRKNIHFPTVWKSTELRTVAIVYWKRVEYYGGKESLHNSEPFRVYHANTEEDTFDPFHEEEMLKGGGFKRVHDPKAKEVA